MGAERGAPPQRELALATASWQNEPRHHDETNQRTQVAPTTGWANRTSHDLGGVKS
jgi:hypothetical protein